MSAESVSVPVRFTVGEHLMADDIVVAVVSQDDGPFVDLRLKTESGITVHFPMDAEEAETISKGIINLVDQMNGGVS